MFHYLAQHPGLISLTRKLLNSLPSEVAADLLNRVSWLAQTPLSAAISAPARGQLLVMQPGDVDFKITGDYLSSDELVDLLIARGAKVDYYALQAAIKARNAVLFERLMYMVPEAHRPELLNYSSDRNGTLLCDAAEALISKYSVEYYPIDNSFHILMGLLHAGANFSVATLSGAYPSRTNALHDVLNSQRLEFIMPVLDFIQTQAKEERIKVCAIKDRDHNGLLKYSGNIDVSIKLVELGAPLAMSIFGGSDEVISVLSGLVSDFKSSNIELVEAILKRLELMTQADRFAYLNMMDPDTGRTVLHDLAGSDDPDFVSISGSESDGDDVDYASVVKKPQFFDDLNKYIEDIESVRDVKERVNLLCKLNYLGHIDDVLLAQSIKSIDLKLMSIPEVQQKLVLIEKLVSMGASMSIKDNEGHTPEMLAKERGLFRAERILADARRYRAKKELLRVFTEAANQAGNVGSLGSCEKKRHIVPEGMPDRDRLQGLCDVFASGRGARLREGAVISDAPAAGAGAPAVEGASACTIREFVADFGREVIKFAADRGPES